MCLICVYLNMSLLFVPTLKLEEPFALDVKKPNPPSSWNLYNASYSLDFSICDILSVLVAVMLQNVVFVSKVRNL